MYIYLPLKQIKQLYIMKKLLLTATIVIGSLLTMNAQTEKGNWTFGGGSTFSYSSNNQKYEYDGNEYDEKEKLSNVTFSADGGYFVIDNLSVGLNLIITSTKETYEGYYGTTDYKSSSFALLPQATYFFRNDSNIAPFLGAKVGYMYAGGEEDSDKYSGLALGANAGLAYFINSNVSVDLLVEYLKTSMSNKEDNDYVLKNSAIGVGVGFSIYF